MGKDRKVNYEDAPEDLKGTGEMIDITGMCPYCHQIKLTKGFSWEDPNEVVARECDCYEAKRERDIRSSLSAVSTQIDLMFLELKDTITLKAIRAALEPVARGEIDSVTFKVESITFTIAKKNDKLMCIKKHTEVEVADENGVPG